MNLFQRLLLCYCSTHTTNPPNRYELIILIIRNDSWNFANYGPVRDTVRFSYDTATIELRIFVGFGSNRTNILKNTQWFTIINYEHCTNDRNKLRICWMYLRIKLNFKFNSWLFLTVRMIFPQCKYNAFTPEHKAWVPKWMLNVEQK